MSTQFQKFLHDYRGQLDYALAALDVVAIEAAAKLIAACRGTVWLIGNGGSAALASHMATDLQLAGKRAVALTDVAAVTTYANDLHFNEAFSSQIGSLVKAGDILIAISGSGKSSNIINACSDALDLRCKTIAITGFDGGRFNGLHEDNKPTVHINIPAQHMGVSQDGHQVVLHLITYWLMERRKVQ